jgi:hypothetical protein
VSEEYSTTPITPVAASGLGGWPVPRLDVPFKVLALRPIQWAYILAAFIGWDTSIRALEPVSYALWYPAGWNDWLPQVVRTLAFHIWYGQAVDGAWQFSAAMFVCFSLFAAAGCFVSWHGRTLVGVLRIWMLYGATPKVSVWRSYQDTISNRPEWEAVEAAWRTHAEGAAYA